MAGCIHDGATLTVFDRLRAGVGSHARRQSLPLDAAPLATIIVFDQLPQL
jgi:hypothetical protein